MNTANGRFLNVHLPGHRFLVIATDGGFVAPYETETLLVAPRERYEVLVTFDGDVPPALETIFYDRGHHLPDPGPRTVLHLATAAEPGTLAALPSEWPAVEPLPVDASTPVRQFVLREEEVHGTVKFTINDEQWPFNNPVEVRQGVLEIWEIRNEAEMDHPFHLHGMFFQVLGDDGRPRAPLAWKDTVNVPQSSTLRFAVRYCSPGMWMFHCHILEHAERGMMGDLMVMP